jgi:hypothetical protein
MSEYQRHEWQTIDRLLTDAEQAAVNALSSHIDVTASGAVVTYSYGDFKHKPRQVLARYFDAYLYEANWGSHVLMFLFPKGLLDEEAVTAYCVDELISLSSEGDHEILEFSFHEEEGGGWIEDRNRLPGLVSLRNEILDGDYRCLYLAWLKAASWQDSEEPEELEEPPVPAGLRKLTPALKRFAEFFDIDRHQIQAAAAASPTETATASDEALRKAIRGLPREECDSFLFRLLTGESGLNLALKHRLKGQLKVADAPASIARRTANAIRLAADELVAAEAIRKSVEAEERRVDQLRQLGKREPQVWQDVEQMLKGYQQYDEAVAHLTNLRDLAAFQKTEVEFKRRLLELRTRFKSRHSFIQRLNHAGLT